MKFRKVHNFCDFFFQKIKLIISHQNGCIIIRNIEKAQNYIISNNFGNCGLAGLARLAALAGLPGAGRPAGV